MSVNTNNAYGKISITDLAIAKVASKTAMGAYGIVEMAARLPRDRYKKDALFPGGGRVFGPVPRDYSFKLNKKLKQLARRSALTYKAQAGAICVLENPAMEAPKTKAVVALAKALNVENKKVLVVLPETNVNFQLSCRNIPSVKPILAQNLNTYEVMNASAVVLVEGAENVINVMLA